MYNGDQTTSLAPIEQGHDLAWAQIVQRMHHEIGVGCELAVEGRLVTVVTVVTIRITAEHVTARQDGVA